MSLDVYINEPEFVMCKCGEKIKIGDDEVHRFNITHNLGKMAQEANLYYVMWRPEEIGIKLASDCIIQLKAGVKFLKNNPEFFKQFNPENGWGDYEGLLEVSSEYLKACEKYPNAEIEVSR